MTTDGGFGPSPLQKAATALSGFTAIFGNPFSELIARTIEQDRLLAETAALANITTAELTDFYQTHPYSLEFIKAAIQAGAKLDEEDIKRTMEEKSIYHPFDSMGKWVAENYTPSASDQHTFIVILPNSDRREVKAAYMKVDGGTLIFEDDDHDTILAYGPGHWVWAERAEAVAEVTDLAISLAETDIQEAYQQGYAKGQEASKKLPHKPVPYPPYEMHTLQADAWLTGYRKGWGEEDE